VRDDIVRVATPVPVTFAGLIDVVRPEGVLVTERWTVPLKRLMAVMLTVTVLGLPITIVTPAGA